MKCFMAYDVCVLMSMVSHTTCVYVDLCMRARVRVYVFVYMLTVTSCTTSTNDFTLFLYFMSTHKLYRFFFHT